MVGDPNTNREGSDRDGNQNARPVRDHSNIGQVRVDKLPASEGIGKLRANYFLCALADRKMKQSFVYDAFLIVRRASVDPEYCSELELTCGGFNRKRTTRLSFEVMYEIIRNYEENPNNKAYKFSRAVDMLIYLNLDPREARELLQKEGIVELVTRAAAEIPLKKRRTATSVGTSGDDWLEEATDTTRCSAPAGVFKYDESVLDALRTNQSGRIEIEFELVETTAGQPVLKILHAGSAEDG